MVSWLNSHLSAPETAEFSDKEGAGAAPRGAVGRLRVGTGVGTQSKTDGSKPREKQVWELNALSPPPHASIAADSGQAPPKDPQPQLSLQRLSAQVSAQSYKPGVHDTSQ